MPNFLRNRKDLACIKSEAITEAPEITLNDCLACSGCISKEEASDFKSNGDLLKNEHRPIALIVSSYVKKNLSMLHPEIPYEAFEIIFSLAVKTTFNILALIDSSSIRPSGNTAGIYTECPAVVLYVERVFNPLVKFLDAQKTQQQRVAEYIAENYKSDKIIVSITPCYDKSNELRRDSCKIDAIVTGKEFYELIKDAMSRYVNSFNLGELNLNDAAIGRLERTHELGMEEARESTGIKECLAILRERVNNNIKTSSTKLSNSDGINSEPPLFLKICAKGCINGPGQLLRNREEFRISNYDPIFYDTAKRVFKRKTFDVEW